MRCARRRSTSAPSSTIWRCANFVKTSGGKGYHVVVPLKPSADWTKVKGFAHDFAKALAQAEPGPLHRDAVEEGAQGRIFIDYLRNGKGSTTVAPTRRAPRRAPRCRCP